MATKVLSIFGDDFFAHFAVKDIEATSSMLSFSMSCRYAGRFSPQRQIARDHSMGNRRIGMRIIHHAGKVTFVQHAIVNGVWHPIFRETVNAKDARLWFAKHVGRYAIAKAVLPVAVDLRDYSKEDAQALSEAINEFAADHTIVFDDGKVIAFDDPNASVFVTLVVTGYDKLPRRRR